VRRGWLVIALLVVVADQLTKWWAVSSLELYQRLPLIEGLNLTLVYNPGAAFSFLSDAGGWQRWFFSALALGVSLFITLWLLRMPGGQRWLATALALVLGGAVGNLIDRIRIGEVIDFIDLYYQHWHWPAFNVADSAISVGAVMLLIDALILSRGGQGAQEEREDG
jgi:signal peptidase II